MATTIASRNQWKMLLGLALAASVATPGCSPFGAPNSSGDSIDELTAADATAGFKSFTAGLIADDLTGTGSIDAGVGDLSDDVVLEIEDLQFEFSSGLISAPQFGTGVREVIGDEAPSFAFAGFDMLGGPFRFPLTNFLTDLLGLTAEQSQAADVIFNDLHDAIDVLRAFAHESIRGVLTPEQVVAIDQRTRLPNAGPGFFLRRLSGEQALSDEQRAAITSSREDLRAGVRELHENARLAFRELLTEEQLKVLDNYERPELDDQDQVVDGAAG